LPGFPEWPCYLHIWPFPLIIKSTINASANNGDWEAWFDFFLDGIRETATNAVATAHRLRNLFDFAYDGYLSILNEGAET